MRRDSLAFRLIVSSAGWSIVILAITGVLLSSLFRAAVERNFDARLRSTLDGLLAVVELDRRGRLFESASIADSRFDLPLSGWYWQVTSTEPGSDMQLRSLSLLEQQIVVPDDVARQVGEDGTTRFYLTDPDGNRLRVLEQKFRLAGSDQDFSFIVTGNFDEIEDEVTAFNQTLIIALTVLAIGLVTASFIQVRYGLRPLRQLRRGLVEVRSGIDRRLRGNFPSEIQPVADELNALLQANEEVVERARTQVGNLAHALKTPLSVIANEAQASRGQLSQKVSQQVEVMRDQINLYLDRARRAARVHALGSLTEVGLVIDSLVRTLQRINADRSIAVETDCPPGLKFLGEKQDLEEMIGNLLDNAFKWSAGWVGVRVAPVEDTAVLGKTWIELTVEDDGPGLPEGRRDEALQRGRRLDETKPGSGLGLAIVAETAAMYGGSVMLGDSARGGLKATLRLPSPAP